MLRVRISSLSRPNLGSIFRGCAGLLVVVAMGCSPAPISGSSPLPDGFNGTWARAVGTDSKISLARLADGTFRFRWVVEQGARRVRCDEVNRCVEFHDQAQVYEWIYHVWRPDGENYLHLERKGTPILTGLTPLSEVDRLELQPGGDELWAYTIERNGEVLSSPTGPYKYVRLSADPF